MVKCSVRVCGVSILLSATCASRACAPAQCERTHPCDGFWIRQSFRAHVPLHACVCSRRVAHVRRRHLRALSMRTRPGPRTPLPSAVVSHSTAVQTGLVPALSEQERTPLPKKPDRHAPSAFCAAIACARLFIRVFCSVPGDVRAMICGARLRAEHEQGCSSRKLCPCCQPVRVLLCVCLLSPTNVAGYSHVPAMLMCKTREGALGNGVTCAVVAVRAAELAILHTN